MRQTVIGGMILAATACIALALVDWREAKSDSSPSRAETVTHENQVDEVEHGATNKPRRPLPRPSETARAITLSSHELEGPLGAFRADIQHRLENFLATLTDPKREAVLAILYDAQVNYSTYWRDRSEKIGEDLDEQAELERVDPAAAKRLEASRREQIEEMWEIHEEETLSRLREVLSEEEFERFYVWWPGVGTFSRQNLLVAE